MKSNIDMNRNFNVFMIASSFYFIICIIRLNRKMIIFDAMTYFGLLFSNAICIYTGIHSIVEKTNNFYQQHVINFIMNTVILNTIWKGINLHFTWSDNPNNSPTQDAIANQALFEFVNNAVVLYKNENKYGHGWLSKLSGGAVAGSIMYGGLWTFATVYPTMYGALWTVGAVGTGTIIPVLGVVALAVYAGSWTERLIADFPVDKGNDVVKLIGTGTAAHMLGLDGKTTASASFFTFILGKTDEMYINLNLQALEWEIKQKIDKMNKKYQYYKKNKTNTSLLKGNMKEILKIMNRNNYFDPLYGYLFFVLSRFIRDQDSNFTMKNIDEKNSIQVFDSQYLSWTTLMNPENYEGSEIEMQNTNHILLYYFICHEDFLHLLFEKTKPMFKLIGCNKNEVNQKIGKLQKNKKSVNDVNVDSKMNESYSQKIDLIKKEFFPFVLPKHMDEIKTEFMTEEKLRIIRNLVNTLDENYFTGCDENAESDQATLLIADGYNFYDTTQMSNLLNIPQEVVDSISPSNILSSNNQLQPI